MSKLREMECWEEKKVRCYSKEFVEYGDTMLEKALDLGLYNTVADEYFKFGDKLRKAIWRKEARLQNAERSSEVSEQRYTREGEIVGDEQGYSIH
ncbi:MAG: hypothetical protein FWE31_00275 [Firmicutes bacterium]|nr:hypothetical protein [Bacillota bacterium]